MATRMPHQEVEQKLDSYAKSLPYGSRWDPPKGPEQEYGIDAATSGTAAVPPGMTLLLAAAGISLPPTGSGARTNMLSHTSAATTRPQGQQKPAAQSTPTAGTAAAGHPAVPWQIERQLSDQDPDCIVTVWPVKQLGFLCSEILWDHFKTYGEVNRVLVVNNYMDYGVCAWTMTPPEGDQNGVAYLVAKRAAVACAILAAGKEQAVGGSRVNVQTYSSASSGSACSGSQSGFSPFQEGFAANEGGHWLQGRGQRGHHANALDGWQ
mmetsp:Transcript_81994/g.240725  ORF Transcript_81994/g.240725 Transcript_81994/m.240725 type:complete len:265 (+) Transcript_81994:95-889(+)